MKILHLDSNHPKLIYFFKEKSCSNVIDYTSPYENILKNIFDINGIVLRSRIPINKHLIGKALGLKFIARIGAGMENIDVDYALSKGIKVFSAKGGNANAVGEHALGMLLSLTKNIAKSHGEIYQNIWKREENRGVELEGKTIGIIGYGNTGQAFAKKLLGFDTQVLFYDVLGKDSQYPHVQKAAISEIQDKADILSLHTPLTPQTKQLLNYDFIKQFKKPIYLLNTARGECLDIIGVSKAMSEGKVLGLGLDVYEFETSSFETLSISQNLQQAWNDIKSSNKVVLTSHIAGWSSESKEKMADMIINQLSSNIDF